MKFLGNGVQRTAYNLADGRDIFYYDERMGLAHPRVDPRDLPAVTLRSQARWDPLLREWVAIASHRQDRTYEPADTACPLCPSGPDRATEVPSQDYDVVVFENRFPSFAVDASPVPDAVDSELLFRRIRGSGRCEVVCFSPSHGASLADVSPRRMRTVVDAWADRTSALNEMQDVAQVFPFENRGAEIGVTLSHPHGQIYGYPFLTPWTERMLTACAHHHRQHGTNLFQDLLHAEQRTGTRVVTRSEHWTAFVPATARWPMEVHMYPNRRVRDLPELDDAQRDDFAQVYLDLLRRLDGLYDMPLPYVSGWHQAPARSNREHAYLHLRLLSNRRSRTKLKYAAGSESGMGVFINDIAPELQAAALREIAQT